MDMRREVLLAEFTTLGVGGPARFFLEARTEDEAAEGTAFARREGLPFFVLGGGSNLLVSDAGFPGLVLRMGIRGVQEAEVGPEVLVEAGAGESWDAVVERCVARNLAGIECLSGIPGTAGGTPVQNVGAYGQEMAQVIRGVRVFDRDAGDLRDLSPADCGFAYRSSLFNTVAAGRYIVLSVTCGLTPGGTPAIAYRDLAARFAEGSGAPSLGAVRDAVLEIRRAKGMLLAAGDPEARSAGSFFKNPTVSETEYARLSDLAGQDLPRYPDPAGGVKLPAARLIELAGFCRGHRRGGAAISARHTLALVNRGGATAADILDLGREIADAVWERFGVVLRPEPVLLGFDEPFWRGAPG